MRYCLVMGLLDVFTYLPSKRESFDLSLCKTIAPGIPGATAKGEEYLLAKKLCQNMMGTTLLANRYFYGIEIGPLVIEKKCGEKAKDRPMD